MLGERLATNRRMLGLEDTWLVPENLGPLSSAEQAARLALGEIAWRHWVARGWLAVYHW
jgi:hypothetical protein